MNDANILARWVKLAAALTKQSQAAPLNPASTAAAAAATEAAIKSVRPQTAKVKGIKPFKPITTAKAGGNLKPGKNVLQASGAGVAAAPTLKPIKPGVG